MQQLEVATADKFTALTQGIRELIAHNKLSKVEEIVTKYEQSDESKTRKLLLRAIVHYLRMEHKTCLDLLGQAMGGLSAGDYPEDSSIFSAALVHSQLSLARRSRPATSQGYNFYRQNIAALHQVDPELADEVQRSPWPDGYQLLEFWSGLHLYYTENKTLLTLGKGIQEKLEEHLSKRGAITFSGVGTGQELRYCLDKQIDILYGMTRTHYLFEPAVEQVKLFLHLFDMSRFLQSQELILFCGNGMARRRDEIFGSRRYPNLTLVIGSPEPLAEHIQVIKDFMDDRATIDRVKEYYAGAVFRERLAKIAAGEIQPRILTATCRWTTFLKHCAGDFERAFAQAGCETRYLIEENDVQTLSPALHWCEVDQFKPDAMFSVSHARPTTPYLPRELPYISYIQDKCGPVLWHPTLDEHISAQDLFVCSLGEFQNYLLSKKVPGHQTFVMPVPTDDKVFYPLEAENPSAENTTCDVSYIKHGNADAQKDMGDWMLPKGFLAPPDEITRKLAEFFQDLYRQFRQKPEQLWYEEDMQNYAQEKLSKSLPQEIWPEVQQLVTTFSVQVYPTCRRRYYLEALADQDMSLRLYGNGWNEDPQFSRFAAGSVERGPLLNAVYNFSRINLHLHPYSTMHQRLSECGLAGGFMMIADHAPQKDWESARAYFEEDKEVVFFHTADKLVERCRYYLAHPEERREIARNMYRRALRERTCKAGAETVLSKWRELLTRSFAK